jgi:hypothetical protein
MRIMEVVLQDGKRIVITKTSSAENVAILNKLLDQELVYRVVYY